MNSEQPKDDLQVKIAALMQYRMLPQLLARVEADPQKRKELLDLLTALQTTIYRLDHYLETTWEIDGTVLDTWWEPIYTALSDLGIPKDKHGKLVKHIQKYQKHELQLREGILPTRLDMEYFYFYKSCDVKLLRQILYIHYPALARMYSAADWRVFDLVTEVDDDVEDVLEDRFTINGNRYLITIWQFGFDEAQKIFLDFLHSIEQCIDDRFGAASSDYHGELFAWSADALRDTRARLLATPSPDLDIDALWLVDRVPCHQPLS